MRKLIRDCATWLNWKVGLAFAAVLLVGLFAFGAEAGLIALLGSTPLLALLVCLIPCAIPLCFLRRSSGQGGTPSAHASPTAKGGCDCGSESCGTGTPPTQR